MYSLFSILIPQISIRRSIVPKSNDKEVRAGSEPRQRGQGPEKRVASASPRNFEFGAQFPHRCSSSMGIFTSGTRYAASRRTNLTNCRLGTELFNGDGARRTKGEPAFSAVIGGSVLWEHLKCPGNGTIRRREEKRPTRGRDVQETNYRSPLKHRRGRGERGWKKLFQCHRELIDN